jgi:branched-chain amino acid transport system permease protein
MKFINVPRFVMSLILIIAVLLPVLGSDFHVAQGTRILVFAIFAMSLDLLVGYAGLVSLGHAAFFGLSAYTAALLSEKMGISNILIALPLSVATAAFGAAVIGFLSLRASGVYFIMVTLAFAQMLYFVVNENDFFGGTNGILAYGELKAKLGSLLLFDMGNSIQRYAVCLCITLLVLWFISRLVQSPFGRVIQGIRSNERRMRALGYPVQRYKLVCFVIAGALAGLAGYLYFTLTSFVDPTIVNWLQSAQLLIIVILGGIGTMTGPIIGAVVFVIFADVMAAQTEHWKLYLGVLVIVVTMYGRGGFVGMLNSLGKRLQFSKDRETSKGRS